VGRAYSGTKERRKESPSTHIWLGSVWNRRGGRRQRPSVQTARQGDGATNPEFIGAYAEYALASVNVIARKPDSLSFDEGASAPVVAVTAWQMLFDYAKAMAGQTVLIQGAAGNVGAYAIQLARQAGLRVFATVSSGESSFVESLGVERAIDYETTRFEDAVPPVDKYRLKAIAEDNARNGIRAVIFLVDVTSERLEKITEPFDRRELRARAGTILTLDQARRAHEMLDAPHRSGKIVLHIADLI
jgi:NADPH:quinone reductase-like Zn-dependent oxidoreductase